MGESPSDEHVLLVTWARKLGVALRFLRKPTSLHSKFQELVINKMLGITSPNIVPVGQKELVIAGEPSPSLLPKAAN